MLQRLARGTCCVIGVSGLAFAAVAIAPLITDKATPLDNSTHALRTAGDTLNRHGLDPKLVISDEQASVLSGDSVRYFDRVDCTSPANPGVDGYYYRTRSCGYFNGKSAEEATQMDEQTLRVNTFVEPVIGQTRAYNERLGTSQLSSLSYEKGRSVFGQTHTPLNVNEIPELKGATKAFADMGRGLKNPSGITLNYGDVTIQVWMQNADLELLLMAAKTVTNNLK